MKTNNYRTSKKAFSMVTAIFVIVIMATVTALIMNVTSKTVKETTQQYQKEQAALLARSYTEQALLYAIHYNRQSNGNCVNQVNATFGPTNNLYTIRTNIQYLGNTDQLPNSGCNIIGGSTWSDDGTLGFNSSISLLVDVYVSYKDFDDPSGTASVLDRNVTFHRRTLQKI
jgi:type II secretory pathway pseudopilin PulG